LADAVGASLVHTNKSARILKSKGLLDFAAGKHRILDFKSLAEYSGFSADYLANL
jgi:hypothetical protein